MTSSTMRSQSASWLAPLAALSLACLFSPGLVFAQDTPQPESQQAAEADEEQVSLLLGMEVAERTAGIVSVTNVEPDGQAAKLKLRRGDVIMSLNGTPVTSRDEFGELLAGVEPGDKIELEVLRGRRRARVSMVAPQQPRVAEFDVDAGRDDVGLLGMFLTPGTSGGAIVSTVSPDTPAAAAGFRRADEIIIFDKHKVTNLDDLVDFAAKLLERKQPGDEIEVVAIRGEEERTFSIVLPEEQNVLPSGAENMAAATAEESIVFCMAVREGAGNKVVVVEVMEQSPAAIAGIQSGDVIAAVGGVEVLTVRDLAEVIKLHQTGSKVEFAIVRAEEPIVTEVTMAPCEFVSTADQTQSETNATNVDAGPLRAQVESLRQQVQALQDSVEALSNTLNGMGQ